MVPLPCIHAASWQPSGARSGFRSSEWSRWRPGLQEVSCDRRRLKTLMWPYEPRSQVAGSTSSKTFQIFPVQHALSHAPFGEHGRLACPSRTWQPAALGSQTCCSWNSGSVLDCQSDPCPHRTLSLQRSDGSDWLAGCSAQSSLPPCRMSRRSGRTCCLCSPSTRGCFGPVPRRQARKSCLVKGGRHAQLPCLRLRWSPVPTHAARLSKRSAGVRELISSGRAMPRDIALAAADPKPWDAALLAARAEACLPLHFSHGIPALETRGGQACASLANLLQHGLSQQRVWRVLAHCASDAPGFSRLPKNALFGIARGAALSEVEHWRAAFAAALPGHLDRQDPWPILLPLLDAAASGLDVAEDAGRLFLPPAAQGLWTEALRQAPSQALPITLDGLHVADARNPGDSVTWGPARHLACSPRKFVRLLGLNAKAWPRQASDDPILPAHILDLSRCGMPGVAAQDRAAFEAIRAGAGGALVLSAPAEMAVAAPCRPVRCYRRRSRSGS